MSHLEAVRKTFDEVGELFSDDISYLLGIAEAAQKLDELLGRGISLTSLHVENAIISLRAALESAEGNK